MKTADSARKRLELRERFMRYVTEYAENDRIPTVEQLRKVLGVTNYMLLNCMNELVREGVIYRKSRKEGTFLSYHRKKYVIGFCDQRNNGTGFVDVPAWMSGFFRAFTRDHDFLLRTVSCPEIKKLPDILRQYGLDVLVYFTSAADNLKYFSSQLSAEVRNKLIFAPVNFKETEVILPEWNTITVDHEYWAREYVRAAVRHHCRNFLIVSSKDRCCHYMLSEIEKQGLTFHPECLITNPGDLTKKLPSLIKKYKIDAVRCAGGMHHSFALAVKNIPSFRPFMPVFGFENMYYQMRHDYPWLNAVFLFEHLDDFCDRWGYLTGQSAKETARTGNAFATRRIRMNYAADYNEVTNTEKE